MKVSRTHPQATMQMQIVINATVKVRACQAGVWQQMQLTSKARNNVPVRQFGRAALLDICVVLRPHCYHSLF